MGIFDSLFDLDGDGKVEVDEAIISIKMTKEIEMEICDDSSESDGFEEDFDDEEDDYAWRKTCDDGSEFGIDPEDYDDEDDYLDDLNEAKYEWREDCEDEGYEYDIDPEDYETEEEFKNALYEAKYGWRQDCEDGSEYGIDPNDYETEDEYLEALGEAETDAEW